MNKHEYEMLKDAMDAIKISEAVDFVKNFSDESFMLSSNDFIYKITKNMSYDGHSGSSFGWTMRKCCYYLNHPEKWEEYINNIS
jgi:hypothetical protein